MGRDAMEWASEVIACRKRSGGGRRVLARRGKDVGWAVANAVEEWQARSSQEQVKWLGSHRHHERRDDERAERGAGSAGGRNWGIQDHQGNVGSAASGAVGGNNGEVDGFQGGSQNDARAKNRCIGTGEGLRRKDVNFGTVVG